MKNQYVGDIGDYTKFGILRKLRDADFSIGINWYLTEDDGSKDGKHREYLKSECKTSDDKLFDILKKINDSGLLSVEELARNTIVEGAVYYNKKLKFNGISWQKRKEIRSQWHKDALPILCNQEIVFLDPDNGLQVKSFKPFTSQKGNKYTTYQEAVDYYKQGATVIIYNHADHRKEDERKERFKQFKKIKETSSAKILCYKAGARYYLFLAQPEHRGEVQKAMEGMLKDKGWSKYLEGYKI